MSESYRNNAARETLKAMREHRISKVVWDIREVTLDYSLIGSHSIILDLPSLGVLNTDFIAVIYRQDAEQHEHSSIVAANLAMDNIRYFRELQEGIDWLLTR
jgi:hypothetical protein